MRICFAHYRHGFRYAWIAAASASASACKLELEFNHVAVSALWIRKAGPYLPPDPGNLQAAVRRIMRLCLRNIFRKFAKNINKYATLEL
ncbi:MAG: hypothetical protein DBX40_02155 [Clostridiales bacterium]|nr:MAG: hypothetical protein DBX40_02155 [Clostridiales bacterium]